MYKDVIRWIRKKWHQQLISRLEEQEGIVSELLKKQEESAALLRQLKQDILDIKIRQDADTFWLHKNSAERMDASRKDLFNETRADFHLARYRFASQYGAGKIVADVACGTGYGSEHLFQAGAKKVVGIDIALEAIHYAKAKHCPEGVSYVCSPANDTGIPSNSVDLVVSFETIEHVEDDIGLIEEFNRILNPGGMLICSSPNQWPLEKATYHVHSYNRKSFEELLLSKFELIGTYNQNSGSDWEFNHGQPAGIIKTNSQNESSAEVYICIGVKRVQ